MRNLILGTAGHIDHGKTSLVRAITGVDTDRLKEEKARGITIELGFAALDVGPDLRFGVVDVPGHEGFVRTMVSGATGMDVVLMVVAGDEGVMPQTREHLAIVRLLGVERLAVALTKTDLVEQEWLELVTDDVRDLLADTPYADAPILETSSQTGHGLDALKEALRALGEAARGRDPEDVVRLPVDRVFTVRGTGTVVTGTLWSGTLKKGQRLQAQPEGPDARVRAVQVHGTDADVALPGSRTAAALTGPEVGRGGVRRGQTLVVDWDPSAMLTVRVTVLPDTGWQLEHGQRVRVHAGTAEVMARCIVPAGVIAPGGRGWIQLRLEAPVVARTGDPLILRSYSPVTTIGGAVVAEPYPAKRSRFSPDEEASFQALVSGTAEDRLDAAAQLAGWAGLEQRRIAVVTGLAPGQSEVALASLEARGGVGAGGRVFHPDRVREAETLLVEAVGRFHRREPLRRGMPLEQVRQALPRTAPSALADTVLRRLEERGAIRIADGVAALPSFAVELSAEALATRDTLARIYESAALAPPALRDLPADLRARGDLEAILDLMLAAGDLRVLDDGLYVWGPALDRTVEDIIQHFGGRESLSPADFREVVPVTRKHLMPLLAFLDGEGITTRRGDLRSVRGV